MGNEKSLSWDAFQQMGNPENAPDIPEETESTPKEEYRKMVVRLFLDRKRGGKEVTVVRGITLEKDELKEIGKQLKSFCGVGGTVKNDEILLQGNHRDKVLPKLKELGFSNVKKSGG